MTDLQPMVYTPVSAVANLRRSAVLGAVLGALAIVVTSLVGHPMMGVFVLLGFALGALNTYLLQKSVLTFARGRMSKKRVQGGVLLRLGAITAVAIGLALIVRPDGYGTFAGLAAFQLLMLVGAAVPLLRTMRPTA
ncbi:MAG: ATP synthase subunit I [Jatrophihabitans sp.]|uniref:ATP synthase subunit I n=1 Tax=Jatrophihabitans sp. TaxID=1932789 RepID=UPI003F7FC3D5